MPRLLVVHHTPSPALQEMFEAAVSGARTDEIEGVEVVIRPALTAAAVDVLQADGYLLGTAANIGYMSGALKHFFDGIYYPCLEATRGRPYGLYVHGASDTGGAVRAVESIATGLQWRKVRPPVSVTGPPGKADLEACWELGALLAAEIAGLMDEITCYLYSSRKALIISSSRPFQKSVFMAASNADIRFCARSVALLNCSFMDSCIDSAYPGYL
jgi:hypothetical protein